MVTLIALGLAAAFQLAPDDPTPVQEPDRVVVVKKTFLDMTESEVRGVALRPTGEYVRARTRVKFRTLIELRGTFRPELAGSVGALR